MRQLSKSMTVKSVHVAGDYNYEKGEFLYIVGMTAKTKHTDNSVIATTQCKHPPIDNEAGKHRAANTHTHFGTHMHTHHKDINHELITFTLYTGMAI